MAQTSVCHLLVRIWLPWQQNHRQLQNMKKIYFLPVLVVLIQRKSAVIVLARVRKYETTCPGPHIAGANPYNSPEGHHIPGWLPWQPILS